MRLVLIINISKLSSEMGGQQTKAYVDWTCTPKSATGVEIYINTFNNIQEPLWTFNNRCTGDPDRISEIRVGFADGFLDGTGGSTIYAPVWVQMLTDDLTIFQKGPHFDSPYTY